MAKSKYETHVLPRFEEIKKWAEKGLLDNQIYKNLGIGKNAFYKYLNEHEDFKDLIKNARKNAIAEVENSLYKLCTGYPYWEEVAQKCKTKTYDEDGKLLKEEEHIEVVSVQKYSNPQVTPIIFYLVNKDKKHWANNPHQNDFKKQEIEIKRKEAEMKEW